MGWRRVLWRVDSTTSESVLISSVDVICCCLRGWRDRKGSRGRFLHEAGPNTQTSVSESGCWDEFEKWRHRVAISSKDWDGTSYGGKTTDIDTRLGQGPLPCSREKLVSFYWGTGPRLWNQINGRNRGVDLVRKTGKPEHVCRRSDFFGLSRDSCSDP